MKTSGPDSQARGRARIAADSDGDWVRFQVLRSVGDPNYVMNDLKFDTLDEAEGLLGRMRRVWVVRARES